MAASFLLLLHGERLRGVCLKNHAKIRGCGQMFQAVDGGSRVGAEGFHGAREWASWDHGTRERDHVMELNRRNLLGILAVAPWVAGPALAAEPETFQTDGVAINGIDPVAYFTDGAPVTGSADHAVMYKGAEWRFASAANKAAFEGDPEKYGAKFGGYCAFAASRGYLAPTIPEAWTVYEDRLYLNASLRARELWLQDIPGNIAAGEANWPGILG